jgi:hypothetical protein
MTHQAVAHHPSIPLPAAAPRAQSSAVAAPRTPAMPHLIAICIADLIILGSLLAMGTAQGIIF